MVPPEAKPHALPWNVLDPSSVDPTRLLLSRARKIRRQAAREMGPMSDQTGFWIALNMSRFLRDIIKLLPDAQDGEEWVEGL